MTEKQKRILIAVCVAAVSATVWFALSAGVTLKPDEDPIIRVFGKPDMALPGCDASFFGTPMSGNVRISDLTDYYRTGEYLIVYRFVFLGIPLKRKAVKSIVMDMDAPEIKLKNGTVCFLRTGERWSFPEFEAADNCDAPQDLKIETEAQVDIREPGIYDARIKACDLSGNCSSKTLKMVVGSVADRDFIPGNYDLEQLDQDHYQLMPGSGPISDSLFRTIYWIGDSNILNLGKYDGIPPDHVIARYAMSPQSFHLPVTHENQQTEQSAAELIRTIRPGRAVIMMGEAEAGSGDPLKLAEDYGTCLDELKQASENTEFYVSAILPIEKDSSEAAATQEQINRVNYCLLQMCREKKIPFFCADHWLMDDTGYGIRGYYLEDGFHLKADHFPAYIDYVRYCMNGR